MPEALLPNSKDCQLSHRDHGWVRACRDALLSTEYVLPKQPDGPRIRDEAEERSAGLWTVQPKVHGSQGEELVCEWRSEAECEAVTKASRELQG